MEICAPWDLPPATPFEEKKKKKKKKKEKEKKKAYAICLVGSFIQICWAEKVEEEVRRKGQHEDE